MPLAKVNGVQLYYEEHGRGQQTVCLSHGLLWSSAMYEAQVRELSKRYRCIAWDHRGQGRSESPQERAHSIEACYHDAVGLLNHLEVETCHWVGLSMGGFVGLRVAARHPERLRSLSLLATASDEEPADKRAKYETLNAVVRRLGTRLVTSRILPIMFGPTWLERTGPDAKAERQRYTAQLQTLPRTITRAVAGVFERQRCTDELENIRCPTLVLHGDEDAAISRSRALATFEAIEGARFVAVESAGHTMTVENAPAVTQALDDFLAEVDGAER